MKKFSIPIFLLLWQNIVDRMKNIMRKTAVFFLTQPVSVTCFALCKAIVLSFVVLLMERVEDETLVVFVIQTDVLHNFYSW